MTSPLDAVAKVAAADLAADPLARLELETFTGTVDGMWSLLFAYSALTARLVRNLTFVLAGPDDDVVDDVVTSAVLALKDGR